MPDVKKNFQNFHFLFFILFFYFLRLINIIKAIAITPKAINIYNGVVPVFGEYSSSPVFITFARDPRIKPANKTAAAAQIIPNTFFIMFVLL